MTEMAGRISDKLSISGECDGCGVVQDCNSTSLFAAAQELETAGWVIEGGDLLCNGCKEGEDES